MLDKITWGLELPRSLEQVQYEDTIDQLVVIDKLGRFFSGISIVVSFLIFLSVTDIQVMGTYHAGPYLCLINLGLVIMLLISHSYCLLIFKPIERFRFQRYVKLLFVFFIIPFYLQL